MEEKMKSTKLGHSFYEITSGNRTFRVRRQSDGEMKGLWTVTEQNTALKSKGVDHWFLKGCESSKRDAMRLIEDEHYAN